MPLLTLIDVQQGFGAAPVLDGANFSVEARERVGLVGRNGAGKSTLLRILGGELTADSGVRRVEPGVRLGVLPQAVPSDLPGSVREIVAGGLGEVGALLTRFHSLVDRLAEAPDDAAAAAGLERVQGALEAADGWSVDQRVEEVLTRLSLDGSATYASLSGGTQRRALLARALVAGPDLLVLDEPTNHLDITTIDWLEELLAKFAGAVVFVSHDRRFLARIATRVDELDRGRLTSWPGSYENFLRRREEALAAEAGEAALFDKKLAREEVWIRQGIKARRTRNEGRVRRLEAMRRERAARRELQGAGKMTVAVAGRSGKQVIEAKDVSFAHQAQPGPAQAQPGPAQAQPGAAQVPPGAPIVRGFSTLVARGDRIGLIGPNGVGKTTLLRLLLGQLKPASGSVRHGTELHIAWFDQHRERLDASRSVMDNVADGDEFVGDGDQRRHVISYLQDFLFTPGQARGPIRALSGGERSRLLLARLLARPSNVLVMDEPTNDLDVETLELLEDLLADYPGTLLLVSHDREFLDNIVTSTYVFEGNGRVGEYVGGYSEWLRQRPTPRPPGDRRTAPSPPKTAPAPVPAAVPAATPAAVAAERPATAGRRKLSYKEQRELDALPGDIDALEAQIASAHDTMADGSFYKGDKADIAAAGAALAADEARLEAMVERWGELEG